MAVLRSEPTDVTKLIPGLPVPPQPYSRQSVRTTARLVALSLLVIPTAWVHASADPTDAFLARDLNGNGQVDDGGELFGNFTVLPDGSLADHGFEVLAEFDKPVLGGNGDGVLDAEDWAYYDLLLWTDTNLNGKSEPEEIALLASSPVVSISIRHRTTRQVDQFGNLLTYWTQVQVLKDDKVLPTKAVDVFFQTP